MAVNKTSLSAGVIIRGILTQDPEVMKRARDVYPVVEDKADLPYIVYRRAGFDQTPVKTHAGSDTLQMEILCFTKSYTEGVELAEAVRSALDGTQATLDGLTIRSCTLTDCTESWVSDAYVQEMIFNCKI